MMKKYLVIILFLLIDILTFARETKLKDWIIPPTNDSITYYTSYHNDINLSNDFSQSLNSFSIYNKTDSEKLIFNGDDFYNVGLSVRYRWLHLRGSYGLILDSNNVNNDIKRFNLQLRSNLRKFSVNARLNVNEGLYLSNVEDIFPERKNLNIVLPNMLLINANIEGLYIFNHRQLSLRSVYELSEWQKVSTGSFLAGFYANFNEIRNTTGMVPDEMSDVLHEFHSMNKVSTKNIGISLGYTYTFVIKENWYINITLVPGIGIEKTKTRDTLNNILSKTDDMVSMQMQIRSSGGWNSRRWYAGLVYFSQDYMMRNTASSIYSNTASDVQLYVGYRINDPLNGKKILPLIFPKLNKKKD